MFRAKDQVDNQHWLDELELVADQLEVNDTARRRAIDLFLSTTPDHERSKLAAVAASLYAGCLIEGDQRSQTVVANAVGVNRITVQKRWKELINTAGLDEPNW